VPDAAIPLGQLLRQAARAVKVGVPGAVWVLASVAAIKPGRGGHSVELVEPDVPRAEAGLLRTYLPDGVIETLRRSAGQAIAITDLVGMTIVVRVTVELHPRWGLSGRVLALGLGIEDSLAKRALEATFAHLRREGLWDRQRLLPAPRDVTLVKVVHPAAAAGWADIAAELAPWAELGLVAVRSVPVPYEGPGAAAGIAAALARATAAVGGVRPDLVLLVRGGGAAVSLGALDNEALARAIATAPVPVITGGLQRATGRDPPRGRRGGRGGRRGGKGLTGLRIFGDARTAPVGRIVADPADAAGSGPGSAWVDRSTPVVSITARAPIGRQQVQAKASKRPGRAGQG